MGYRHVLAALAGCAALSLSAGDARAQFRGLQMAMAAGAQRCDGTVTGMGAVKIPLKPTALRMHIELVGRGKTFEEALANLKDRREAAMLHLEKLKADMKSVRVRDPKVLEAESDQRRQMEQMLRERLRGRGGKPGGGPQASKPRAVSAALTAEWPLQAGAPEQMLLAIEAIRERVTAADLAGTKASEKSSPEEQEEMEEAAGMMMGQQMPNVGEPIFVFVAPIPADRRDKAMAEAFQKSKAQAQQLAAAAGVQLGPLAGLSSLGSANTQLAASLGYERFSYMQRMMGMAEGSDLEDEISEEAMSTSLESLSYQVVVTASFSLRAQ